MSSIPMQSVTLDPADPHAPDRDVLTDLSAAFQLLDPAGVEHSEDFARRRWEDACNRLGHLVVRAVQPGIDAA